MQSNLPKHHVETTCHHSRKQRLQVCLNLYIHIKIKEQHTEMTADALYWLPEHKKMWFGRILGYGGN